MGRLSYRLGNALIDGRSDVGLYALPGQPASRSEEGRNQPWMRRVIHRASDSNANKLANFREIHALLG